MVQQNIGMGNLSSGMNFSMLNIMGIINATDDIKMNRMVLRTSRNRAMATFFDLDLPVDVEANFGIKKTPKKIFIIFYPSDGKEILQKKLIQICDLLSASRYAPPNASDRLGALGSLENTIKEKKEYLHQAELSIKNFLKEMSGNENKPAK